jgi:hypothetical protein
MPEVARLLYNAEFIKEKSMLAFEKISRLKLRIKEEKNSNMIGFTNK